MYLWHNLSISVDFCRQGVLCGLILRALNSLFQLNLWCIRGDSGSCYICCLESDLNQPLLRAYTQEFVAVKKKEKNIISYNWPRIVENHLDSVPSFELYSSSDGVIYLEPFIWKHTCFFLLFFVSSFLIVTSKVLSITTSQYLDMDTILSSYIT